MAYVKSFKSFQTAEEKEIGANAQMIKEEDVMLTDVTLKDLSAKILQHKTQINLWEKAIEDRKKILADTLAKNTAAAKTAAANQPAAPIPTPAPTT